MSSIDRNISLAEYVGVMLDVCNLISAQYFSNQIHLLLHSIITIITAADGVLLYLLNIVAGFWD